MEMAESGPEVMDVDPHREQAFRRGYISGIYDALLGVKGKLTEDEFTRLETWVHQSLCPWAKTNLQRAVRPPPPSDATLLPAHRKHGDGPFTLS
jgi:flagellar motor switch protein FliM